MSLWDEIINAHVNGMIAVLRMSQEVEAAMRAESRENNNDTNENRKEKES